MKKILHYKIRLTVDSETKREEIVKLFPSLLDGALDAAVVTAEDGTITSTIKEPGIGEFTISGKNNGTEEYAIIQTFLLYIKPNVRSDGVVGGIFPAWNYEDFKSMFLLERVD